MSSIAQTTSTNLQTPKIEPKTEPFDEPYYFHKQPPQQQTQQTQPTQTQQTQEASSSSTFYFPQTTLHNFLTPEDHLPLSIEPPENDAVYSEFSRISELFRTAFAQRYGDVTVLDPNTGAIVPVPQNDTQAVVPRRKYTPRSRELVRVADLSIEDDRHFRDVLRRTRMVFDALRILCIVEEEKRVGPGLGRRTRGDLRAAGLMRNRELWLNRDKRIVGTIPGVVVGDVFFFRMELCVVGLHGQAQAGIDYMPPSPSSNGEPIATSVIVSGGYEDDEDRGDEIIYTGHGGQDKFNRQCEHQKLEGGNLAMERSMHYGIEVRVIRGFKYTGFVSSKVYVYDGLYKIMECWFDVGKSGFGVYKYRLSRIEGQPQMGSTVMKFAQELRSNLLGVRPKGYLCLDISMKKENIPVLLFNDIDCDNVPLFYEYAARIVFPPVAVHQGGNGSGCDCQGSCGQGCLCAMKNGGQFPYDFNGLLVRGKPVIFECGPHCRCPPTCRNRVTQHGLRNRLEVFRSRETGWGVRSLELIHAGAFICEYAGVALTREQAEILSMNGDSSLVFPGRFTDRWAEWGDLSQIFSDYVRPSYPSLPPLDFAIDVSRMRNAACYISHSSSPNVLVQFVLYDHNNLCFPHLMLFAMENIPPMRELSLDYGVADECTGKLAICN